METNMPIRPTRTGGADKKTAEPIFLYSHMS